MNAPSGIVWQQALAHVPGAESAEPPRVQALAGGTTNATFRVGTAQGDFVVRLHEPYSLDLGVNRRREAVLHAAAAQAGIASRIIAADPDGRYLVTEFLQGEPWRASDLCDEGRVWAIARVLHELHALPAPKVPPLDVGALLERHIAHIATQDAAAGQALLPQLTRAKKILARQAEAGSPACIVHGDLTHLNMIGATPRLVDWEYAVVADPLMDLACLVAYYPQLLSRGAQLLRRCGIAPPSDVPALEDMAWVYRLLSNLWYRRLALAGRHPPAAH